MAAVLGDYKSNKNKSTVHHQDEEELDDEIVDETVGNTDVKKKKRKKKKKKSKYIEKLFFSNFSIIKFILPKLFS